MLVAIYGLPEFEYPLKDVRFLTTQAQCKRFGEKYIYFLITRSVFQQSSVGESFEWWDSFIWNNHLNGDLKSNLCSC